MLQKDLILCKHIFNTETNKYKSNAPLRFNRWVFCEILQIDLTVVSCENKTGPIPIESV